MNMDVYNAQAFTVKVVMLKGEKGDQGEGSYDDTEVRELIAQETLTRGQEYASITALAEASNATANNALTVANGAVTKGEVLWENNNPNSDFEEQQFKISAGGQTVPLAEYYDMDSYDWFLFLFKMPSASTSPSAVAQNMYRSYFVPNTSTKYTVEYLDLPVAGNSAINALSRTITLKDSYFSTPYKITSCTKRSTASAQGVIADDWFVPIKIIGFKNLES